jgi:hypothetical protein
VTLHDGQELDDDLGGRTDHDLALAGLLGVVDSIEAIVEDGSLDHFGGIRRFSSGEGGRLRYLQWKSLVSLQMPEHGECPQPAQQLAGSSALVAEEKQCRAHPQGRARVLPLAL